MRFILLLLSISLLACKEKKMVESTKTYAFRLKPGEDLRLGIEKLLFTREKDGSTEWPELQVKEK